MHGVPALVPQLLDLEIEAVPRHVEVELEAARLVSGDIVHAGDTVYISGGTTSNTYSSGVTISASGSSDASRVTLAVGQDAGHNGLVFLGGNLSMLNQSYVTVNGGYNGAIHLFIPTASEYYIEMAQTTWPRLLYVDAGGGIGSDVLVNAIYGTNGEIAYCNFHDIYGDACIRFNARNSGTTNYNLTFVHNNSIKLLLSPLFNGEGPDGIHRAATRWAGCRFTTTYSASRPTPARQASDSTIPAAM